MPSREKAPRATSDTFAVWISCGGQWSRRRNPSQRFSSVGWRAWWTNLSSFARSCRRSQPFRSAQQVALQGRSLLKGICQRHCPLDSADRTDIQLWCTRRCRWSAGVSDLARAPDGHPPSSGRSGSNITARYPGPLSEGQRPAASHCDARDLRSCRCEDGAVPVVKWRLLTPQARAMSGPAQRGGPRRRSRAGPLCSFYARILARRGPGITSVAVRQAHGPRLAPAP